MNDRREELAYWINERHSIHRLRQNGMSKPWSPDPIFQNTYFCNVHREDDKVTKFIRKLLNSAAQRNFEWWMCVARIFNWPPTIKYLHRTITVPEYMDAALKRIEERGDKIWGGAYVITTHGQPMSKRVYCVDILTKAFHDDALKDVRHATTLDDAYRSLLELEGFASFLAAQVVADLKNTDDHTLHAAPDWWTFAAPGPGSKRGLNYFFNRDARSPVNERRFKEELKFVRQVTEPYISKRVPDFCNQDLQNCLCEFSKYMRIKLGEGRSKRKYDGGAI